MAGEDDDNDKLQILKNALYDEARSHGSEERLFTQKDLIDLGVIPDSNLLLLVKVVQSLCDDRLLVGVSSGSGIAWRWRNREDAKKYTSLPNEETMMVYAVIDEAGADGIWNRTIKNKLNMHENLVKQCIKHLETKGYIASMKNVEHPNKKMYIKANLRPSDRATGGPWFTEGELDTAFIDQLKEIIFEYIKSKSAYLGSLLGQSANPALRPPRKGTIRGTAPSAPASDADATSARGTKRAATDISNDESPAPARAPEGSGAPRRPPGKVYLPMPAGYRHYPTVPEIAQLIHDTGITNNTTLGEADIQQLVDVLRYDGLIEPIKVNGRRGYRVARPTKQDTVSFAKRQKDREAGIGLDLPIFGMEPPGNGLTEVPCGRCPVFELCEEGGPVSPANCVYFDQWLEI